MLGIQLIGFAAVACLFVMFVARNRRSMLQVHILTAMIWALHYALLNAPTASAVNLLRASRDFLSERYRTQKWIYVAALAALILILVVTWRGWISVLPVVGTVITTTALWLRNPRRIRFVSLFVPPIWFTYNFVVGSYAGMTSDIITLSSVLFGIYRFDIRPKLQRRPLVSQEAATETEPDSETDAEQLYRAD